MADRRKILIVDADGASRRRLVRSLSPEYDVCSAATAEEAMASLGRFRPHLVAIDTSVPGPNGDGGDGLDILRKVRASDLSPEVVLVAAGEDTDEASRAIEMGAFDYYVKPIDLEEFRVLVRRALRIQRLGEGADAASNALSRSDRFEHLVASCDAMRTVLSLVHRVSETDVGVLIVGECGTGKELIARAIHHLSPRSAGPFVALNASAIPEARIELEVLGRGPDNRGDGSAAIPGALENADSGTLFLDGVDHIPLTLQGALFSFLKEGRIRQPGADHPLDLDVRIVAASDHVLDSDVESGRIREDLFYRVGVVTIALPPLRERREDIAVLGTSLMRRFAAEHRRKVAGFSKSAMRVMMSYSWPGNIAEMENRVRRAVVVARGRFLTPSDLGLDGQDAIAERTLREARNELERGMVVDALRQNAGNVSRAARAIGVSRPTMYDLIKKYELDVADFKGLAGV